MLSCFCFTAGELGELYTPRGSWTCLLRSWASPDQSKKATQSHLSQ